jgi:hypothetical protein
MIDIDAVKRLNVQDGDLLVVPAGTDMEHMRELGEALRMLMPNGKVIIVNGPIQQLDVATMNDMGWYRA